MMMEMPPRCARRISRPEGEDATRRGNILHEVQDATRRGQNASSMKIRFAKGEAPEVLQL